MVGTLSSYDKPWLSICEQLEQLESRGLIVSDSREAEYLLKQLGYYRFSGYCLAFEKERHRFIPGTTFEQVRDAYLFDADLRRLLAEAIEEIEITLRSTAAYTFGEQHGAFGHTESSNFFHRFTTVDPGEKLSKYEKWINTVRGEAGRSKDLFVIHFETKYRDYPDLPIWVATEIMSFGSLSRMISIMVRNDQRAIASVFNLQPYILVPWLHHFCYVRNLCAHHARLWDRIWSIKPEMPNGPHWTSQSIPSRSRLFITLLMIQKVLRRCPASRAYAKNWKRWIEEHLDNLPKTPDAAYTIGLPDNWKQHPLWA